MTDTYAPLGPIDEAPYFGHETREVRLAALAAALDGVELGDYDRRIVEWLAGWDDPTCRTVVSLFWRARRAAAQAEETPGE